MDCWVSAEIRGRGSCYRDRNLSVFELLFAELVLSYCAINLVLLVSFFGSFKYNVDWVGWIVNWLCSFTRAEVLHKPKKLYCELKYRFCQSLRTAALRGSALWVDVLDISAPAPSYSKFGQLISWCRGGLGNPQAVYRYHRMQSEYRWSTKLRIVGFLALVFFQTKNHVTLWENRLIDFV